MCHIIVTKNILFWCIFNECKLIMTATVVLEPLYNANGKGPKLSSFLRKMEFICKRKQYHFWSYSLYL